MATLQNCVRPFSRAFSELTLTKLSYLNFVRQKCTDAEIPQMLVFNVETQGKLAAKLPYSLSLKPTDPFECPDANKALISLSHRNGSQPIEASYTGNELTLYSQPDFDHQYRSDVDCLVQLPLVFDLKVDLIRDATLSLDGFENETTEVSCENGNCTLTKLKSYNNFKALCKNGNIQVKKYLLTKSAEIRTDGTFQAEKLEGSLTISANGISVESMYGGPSCLENRGCDPVTLGSVHGQCCVQSLEGHVTIGSVDGDIQVTSNTGNVEVFLAKPGNVTINSKSGNVNLKMSKECSSYLELEASHIEIDPELEFSLVTEEQEKNFKFIGGHLSGGQKISGKIMVNTTNGYIKLTAQSWLDSLNLGKN